MKNREREGSLAILREVLIVLSFILLFIFYKVLPNMKDLEYAKKAELVQIELRDLRVAIEKYYQLTGTYPELSKAGVCDNLRLLDYVDENGNKISFADIYKKDTIGMTQASDKFSNNNRVFDNNDFTKINGLAGWNYDYSGNTGEIHANLKPNTYFQGVNWSEE